MFYQYHDAAFFRGKTIVEIDQQGCDEIRFTLSDGKRYRMFHQQNCCEYVRIQEILGKLTDLVGEPLLVATEESESKSDGGDSETTTTYFFKTLKGAVSIIWLGSSNGYYSESVEIEEVE